MPENNRKSYLKRSMLYTAIVAVLKMGISLKMYDRLFRDEVDGQYFLYMGILAAVIFVVWQLCATMKTLAVSESEANLLRKEKIAAAWAKASAGGTVIAIALTMLTMLIVYEESVLGRELLMYAAGILMLGVLSWLIAYGIALLIAPKEYRPWRSEWGYRRYLEREAYKRAEARLKREKRAAGEKPAEASQAACQEQSCEQPSVIDRKDEGTMPR